MSALAFACTAGKPSSIWEGQIRGKSGNVLAGVTLEWKGQKRYTNDLGQFSIPAGEGDSLKIHAVGFLSQTVLIKKERDLSIVLTEQQPELRQIP